MSPEILIPNDSVVMAKINLMRSQKVMLDADLAQLYGVETKQPQGVRRNLIRSPDGFMFELNVEEIRTLKYRFGTSKMNGRGGTRYTPIA